MKKNEKILVFITLFAIALVCAMTLSACSLFGGCDANLTVEYDDTHIITEGDSLANLKPYLTVTYTDKDGIKSTVTDYTLSGTLTVGQSKVTVTYKELSYNVTVNVFGKQDIKPNPNPNPNPQPSIKEYTVTFVADGVTVSSQKYTAENKSISVPQVPSKTGYTGEWEKYVLTDENIVVSAVYTIIQYNVKFVAGSSIVYEQEYSVDNKNIFEPMVPIKEGYNGEWEKYTLTNGNLTVNAVYTPKQYVASLEYNGATGNNAQLVATVIYDQRIGELPIPTKEGFSFVGWQVNSMRLMATTVWQIDESEITFVAQWRDKSIATEGLEYTLNSDKKTYSVSGLGTAIDTDIVIPSTYNEKNVRSISDSAFENCSSLTSVTISDGLQHIGQRAFSGCTNIASITIGNSVMTIGQFAFNSCIGLTNVTLPSSVISIYKGAFCDCNGLISITIPNSITSIGEYAFAGCSNLTSVTIPDSVTSIDRYAFYICSSLTRVTIPDSVTSIGSSAFAGCSNLTSVTIPDSVTSIGGYAFSGCGSLTSITLPKNLASIASCTFSGCSKLTNVEIPESVTAIYYGAFRLCSSLTSITIPNSVTYMDSYVFSKCSSLENITMPFVGNDYASSYLLGSVFGKDSYDGGSYTQQFYADDDQEKNIFYIPYSLRSVTITGGVILYGAFYNCRMLTSITITDGVTSIGDYAFSGCWKLTSITITGGVTSIGDYAFRECSKLTNIIIPDSVITIGDYAFCECFDLTSIVIPDSVITIGNGAFVHCNLESVIIGKSVTSIGDYAFCECFDLTSIVIPDSVITIGNGAFVHCNLESVIIGKSVTSIGDYAFRECSKLTSIIIPDSVITIGNYAFDDCNLKSVAIYNGVKSIGKNAFDCSTITFEGTIKQWNDIIKDENWQSTREIIIICSDGTLYLYS